MPRNEDTVRKKRTIPPSTDSLSKAAIFVAIARAGSFAGAAADLGMARSTISQHVRSLEERLGVRLIERSTRKLRLTDEGDLLYARMSDALDSWQDVLSAFDERRHEPSGTLRVSAPSGLTTSLVGPVLAAMLSEFPNLDAELFSDDEITDLLANRIDIAVRMAPLTDSRLIAKLLFHDRLILISSPEFAAELPERCDGDLEMLANLPWISHSHVPSQRVFVEPDGQPRAEIAPRYRAHGSSSEAQLILAARGVGVVLMPSVLVRDHLESGSIVRIFPDICGRELPIYAVYPAKQLLPARSRVFLTRIADESGVYDPGSPP